MNARAVRYGTLRSSLQSTVRRLHLAWLALGGLLLLLTGCTAAVSALPTSVPRPPTPQAVAPTVPPAQSFADLTQRALRIPHLPPQAACPVTPPRTDGISPDFRVAAGAGPIYTTGGFAQTGVLTNGGDPDADGWRTYKVLWIGAPAHAGPVLIRGRQLDGPNVIRFNQGRASMRFQPPADGGAAPSGWYNWPTSTRLRAPGCDAYQVDGRAFSYLIVFRATDSFPQAGPP